LRETTGGNTGTAPASLPHHLLSDPAARYTDLGHGYYQARTDKDKRIKNHIRQIEALLGHPITIAPKAA
jgi:transposase